MIQLDCQFIDNYKQMNRVCYYFELPKVQTKDLFFEMLDNFFGLGFYKKMECIECTLDDLQTLVFYNRIYELLKNSCELDFESQTIFLDPAFPDNYKVSFKLI